MICCKQLYIRPVADLLYKPGAFSQLVSVSKMLRFLALALLAACSHAAVSCPQAAATEVAQFSFEDVDWTACEDLSTRAGTLALVSSSGAVEWFEKGFEPYTQGSDDEYYLNLSKSDVMRAAGDVLAVKLLSNYSHLTYDLVRSAVPPMVRTGVRTFVGSRAASVDTTLSDLGEDANGYGFPSISSYVINLVRNSTVRHDILCCCCCWS